MILGYDDHCSKCTGVARGVEAASQGRLEVMPLRSSAFRDLAREPLQDRPSLLTFDEAGATVVVGPRIALALVRRLGVRGAWRVSAELWRVRSGRSEREGLTRGTFIAGGLGITAGLWMLGTSGANGAQPAPSEQIDPRDWIARFQEPTTKEELSDADAVSEWAEVRDGAGVMGVVSMPEFQAVAGARAFGMRQSPSRVIGTTQQNEAGDLLRAVAVQDGDCTIVNYSYVVDGLAGQETRAYRVEDSDMVLIGLHDGRADRAAASACPSRCAPGQCSHNPCEFCSGRCCRANMGCFETCCVPCVFACSNWASCLACILVWCPWCATVNNCCQATNAHCFNNCV